MCDSLAVQNERRRTRTEEQSEGVEWDISKESKWYIQYIQLVRVVYLILIIWLLILDETSLELICLKDRKWNCLVG